MYKVKRYPVDVVECCSVASVVLTVVVQHSAVNVVLASPPAGSPDPGLHTGAGRTRGMVCRMLVRQGRRGGAPKATPSRRGLRRTEARPEGYYVGRVCVWQGRV
ncbi:hypothetical protein E2C01_092515 [Portunus trituberculatus]|uniref:Uncharacterized protein n=1 Tax=Portunus trituberculatus TaxID=210409 RepID=A0A5B7JXY9_PORTR|nr:hypothetical protein [Portunus trituberculatus]